MKVLRKVGLVILYIAIAPITALAFMSAMWERHHKPVPNMDWKW